MVLLFCYGLLVQTDADGGAVIRCGFGSNRVAELCADTAAEIQAEAAGLLVAAAVVAGEDLFKDPGQILRRDADAGVADDERWALPDKC